MPLLGYRRRGRVPGVAAAWLAFGVASALLLGACGDGGSDGSDATDGGAASAATGDTAERAEIRVVSQNILHGIFCPSDTDGCRLPERVGLFLDQLEGAGCPDVVTLQEANQGVVDLVADALPETCEGVYELAWDDDPGVDREVFLSRLPIEGMRRHALAGPLRTVTLLRVRGPVGVVDVWSTHLASGADDRPCDEETCPSPCDATGSLQTCQAVELLGLVDEATVAGSVVLVVGDLNATVEEPTVRTFLDEGFADTHLAAGNPECDPATGEQCTSGREDEALDDLTDPDSRQDERIDYVLLRATRDCEVVAPTGLFGAEPARDGPAGLAYASDHTAVEATVACETSATDRELDAPLPDQPATTTTTASGAEPSDGDVAAIDEAYHTFFDGDVTDLDAKVAVLEDGAALRDVVVAGFESVGDLATRTSVRVDDVVLTGPDTAEVTFTLLLDGEVPTLADVEGAAVRVDGRWKVAAETYCSVALAGADEVPDRCS